MIVMSCTYCLGSGCEECDGTGKRYRIFSELDDGTSFNVTGSGSGPSDEQIEALRAMAQAARDKMAAA